MRIEIRQATQPDFLTLPITKYLHTSDNTNFSSLIANIDANCNRTLHGPNSVDCADKTQLDNIYLTVNDDKYKDNPLSHRPWQRFGQDRSQALTPHVTQ